MSSRLHAIAAENQTIAADGRYYARGGSGGTPVPVKEALEAAASGTRCHQPDEPLNPPRPGAGEPTRVEVTSEKSLDAARRLCDAGPGEVAVLNFASARNPGGGYLRGAKAQEEDLCRESLLYTCLLQAQHDYYEPHRASDDLFYSDRVIWSPQVPVHRGNSGALLAQPYRVSFLTGAAPNATQLLRRDPDAGPRIADRLHRRAGRVLDVAAHHGARRLVLGAWGCGVFGNDPNVVARSFHHHLSADGGFHQVFDEVVFAVWDRTSEAVNRRSFELCFEGSRG
jgi:uncharacterized protein (TIGR02452 family)